MIKARDHLGQEFKSLKEMCRHWGIKYETFLGRFNKHGDIKTALTTEVKKQKHVHHNIKCTDHLGNKFNSLKDMCDFHGVTYATFKSRYRKSNNLKTSLTKEIKKKTTQIMDYLGNVFKNQEEMCKYHGISLNSFRNNYYNRRLNLKISLTKEKWKKEKQVIK